MVLAADVGGTKTYIGVFTRAAGGAPAPLAVERLRNADYPKIEDAIRDFLRRAGKRRSAFDAACLGLACPIIGPVMTLTNMDWKVDAARLKRAFGFKRLSFLNDVEAAGWGIGVLKQEDFMTLQRGEKNPGNMALIAAGTGLGEAILFWDGNRHVPSPSEGGHADFAPRGRLQEGLNAWLGKKLGHVSYETVLSGPGLESIYNFLKKRRRAGTPEHVRRLARLGGSYAFAVTAEGMMTGGDGDARAALDLFVSVYGAEAGNLALKALATGGVYIGGGIAPRILGAMERENAFIRAFTDKGRFKGLLSRVPVKVVLNDRAALYGAARRAFDTLPGGRAA